MSYYLPNTVEYDFNIPTPKDILGFDIGKWQVSHDHILMYRMAVANVSDRVP